MGQPDFAEQHPSWLAEDGEHLRMTLVGADDGRMCGHRSVVVVAQKTQWRFNKLPRQVAMIHHDSDPSVNLSKPLQKTRIRKREMHHGFFSYGFCSSANRVR
jgi:hypothetical protein